jgi:hypothetical protein
MNTMNCVADLSVALPGEMDDMEAILGGDSEFLAHMDAREAEALEFQMDASETF